LRFVMRWRVLFVFARWTSGVLTRSVACQGGIRLQPTTVLEIDHTLMRGGRDRFLFWRRLRFECAWNTGGGGGRGRRG
jgi:hypothetical protein